MSEFIWTDELVIKFNIWFNNEYASPHATDHHIKKFIELLSEQKKDWEIVSYKHSDSGAVLKRADRGRFFLNGQFYCEENITNPQYKIHSVKRLSDNEVFSVGDLINDGYTTMKIEKIQVENDSIVLTGNIGNMQLRFAKKARQPLFTTEDGKDIFEGDEFYHVCEDWSIAKFGTCPKLMDYSKSPDRDFSAEQLAKEYIIKNKPALSVKDVLKCHEMWQSNYYNPSNRSMESFLKHLIEQI